jgi:superoxide dismutase, Cu-Zn family
MRISVIPLAVFGFFLLGSTHSAFGQSKGDQPTVKAAHWAVKAVAVLHPTAGNKVTGVVTFTETPAGIKVVADIEGLTPGRHGFHVHQYGDCSAANADSAGGHFNPEGMPHGGPTSRERHVGDLGNVTADEDGKAHLEWTDKLLSFDGRDSIIGRGLVVHGAIDDLTSQPAGNAGPRVACGVIGIAGK